MTAHQEWAPNRVETLKGRWAKGASALEREFHDIIAEELSQQGLTYSGIESAARRVAALRRTEPFKREAIRALIRTAQLLQQNSEGCAVNHHGLDFEQQGLPGWLRDTQASIDITILALSAQPAPESSGGEI